MNLLQWMLVLHVTAAAFVVGWGLALLVLALRAHRLGEHVRSLHAIVVPVGRFGALPATAVLLATGVWLTSTFGFWRAHWLWAAFVLFVVYGAGFERWTRQAIRAISETPTPEALTRLRKHAILQAMALFLIVLLMVARPF